MDRCTVLCVVTLGLIMCIDTWHHVSNLYNFRRPSMYVECIWTINDKDQCLFNIFEGLCISSGTSAIWTLENICNKMQWLKMIVYFCLSHPYLTTHHFQYLGWNNQSKVDVYFFIMGSNSLSYVSEDLIIFWVRDIASNNCDRFFIDQIQKCISVKQRNVSRWLVVRRITETRKQPILMNINLSIAVWSQ